MKFYKTKTQTETHLDDGRELNGWFELDWVRKYTRPRHIYKKVYDLDVLLSHLGRHFQVREITPKDMYMIKEGNTEGVLKRISKPSQSYLDEIAQSGGYSDWHDWENWDNFSLKCDQIIQQLKNKMR